MRCKIVCVSDLSIQMCGREALEKTTLKSLGLSGGKAILRLLYRDHEQLRTQAHVSTPLLPKAVATADTSTSDKDYQRLPSSMLHCNKTTNDSNLPPKGVSKMENQESRGKARTDTKEYERIDALRDEKQERDISKTGESHSIASSHEVRYSEADQRIAGTCAKVEENAYEIKFVRCNCAYVQSHSSDGFTYRGSRVTVRGEKRSSVQSSWDSSIAEGRIARQLLRP